MKVKIADSFAAALRELRRAAGNPSYRSLSGSARTQRPPVSLGVATLSDWFNGRCVPSDPQALRFLVETLEARAERRAQGGSYRPRNWQSWERMRQEALAEARANGARGRVVAPAGEEVREPDGQGQPVGHARRWRCPLWLVPWRRCIVVVPVVVGVLAVAAWLAGYLHTPVRTAGVSAPPVATYYRPPEVIAADGKSESAERLPGPNRWFVAHNVKGADACPPHWACFFKNPDFNADPGWMIMVQDLEKTYELTGQYENAVSSWVNNMRVQVAWHPVHDAGGDLFYHMEPGARRARLGAADKTAQSIHTMSNANAWPQGTPP
ncbi:peptidase inhibitor family I36 protein [Streptomyces orinoci]|uniref:Peptidase inhibitor family I36 protein n=1 Tax=Streptomyces orinoci TaxID=67339 RepID=A0ABV3JZT4_STRON|nr:peptidase inhibitor family I36 protein [Streptomyces orinoci]